jgi:signal transduction histidine kinase
MRTVGWLRPERRLLGIFLGVTVLPTAGLAWLGWQLVALDRSLAETQIEDRLKSAIAEVTSAMRHDLQSLDPLEVDPGPSAGAVVVEFRQDRVAKLKGSPLVFVPVDPSAEQPEASTWDVVERHELAGAADEAIAEYSRRARSADDRTRAGALVRRARALRSTGRLDEALASYAELASIEHAQVFGDPAPLVARAARARTLDALGHTSERDEEARALAADLAAGRWAIGRATFGVAWRQVGPFSSNADSVAELTALAAGVEALWADWRDGSRTDRPWTGNRTASLDGLDARGEQVPCSVVLAWRGSGDAAHATALVASPRFLEARWAPEWQRRNLRVALIDESGSLAAGSAALSGPVVDRAPGHTGLPWTVRAASAEPEREFALQQRRRWLVGTVIGIAVFLVLAGAYFVARGAGRELAAARLQADFVAAVSHELRTPISSMSHLIEMLGGARPIDDPTRQRYYVALAQEAGRLRRFVDRLLSLGRAEARRTPYSRESLDPVDVVTDVVAGFRDEPAASGRRVALAVGDVSAQIEADREAIGLALHNLLENAAKYSPPGTPIVVELAEARSVGRVTVRVQDEGPGVPPGEREWIFEKFTRGTAAAQSGAPGTGIGLALARQIARAHGGDITLEGGTPTGTTFMLMLPVGKTETTSDRVAERATEPASRG